MRALAPLLLVCVSLPSVAAFEDHYSGGSSDWRRANTPDGHVYSCLRCKNQVQVQVSFGPPLPADGKVTTSAQFVAAFDTDDKRKAFFDGVLRQSAPIPGLRIEITRTGVTKLGGVPAIQVAAIVHLAPTATRDTTIMGVHRGRVFRVSLNYHDGGMTPTADAAIKALYASFVFK